MPVRKGIEKTYVENYRPISLLSLTSKVLERCVFYDIKHHVFQQIHPCQHGFVPGKSCVTQLIEVFEQNGRKLDGGEQKDVIYLDMSKAFDKVSHAKLLHRLREFGFRGNILNWFSSYLSNRRQQTTRTARGATSRPLAVTSGVPQGSILGPLLFLLYEHHLSNIMNNSTIATFADDTKIFRTISSTHDATSLQEVLTSFEVCSNNVNLILNVKKCKILRITRKQKKIEYPYKLHNTALECTELVERDLGVWTSSNLTWSKHVECQCTQANKMLGYIRRSKLDIKTISVRRTLYLSLVRSQLCWLSSLGSRISQLDQAHGKSTKTSNQIHSGSSFLLRSQWQPETWNARLVDLIPVLLARISWYDFLQMHTWDDNH